jgi:3-oxoacyl-(acyl-carrier-protein) synthase
MGLEEAVREVLKSNQSIYWLALHATGTKVWDSIEMGLVSKIFGEQIPHLSAFKRTFGHALGSACLLSIAMIAEGLANQRLPVLPHPIDPAFNLSFPKASLTHAKRAMNWSVGMGGTVAVNLFESCHDN